ncbi:S46 family peptidase [Flavobacterium agrisoli]|uniref:Dipeptidyl-peptidase n=1 Tax=Flavobacterium agrisoli TaxID=2793066 RepID=A0A934PQ21_9FLAO|nr:S46 family peptidase [Flavobacterium agrisoli]MBK0370970.1 S46 family peptidase [Flavobacterium agrisoli]
MKKIILLFTICLMAFPVRADEGMWFLMFIERLNHRDMEKMGLQLTAEEIYSINHHSLKDAIVQFNGGCTAEIVSNNGLVLTNHHCGYSAIAELSTEEQNYLRDGFWAKERSQEMKPKSLYVRFFVRMDDCTKRILAKVNDTMTEEERNKAIQQEMALIEKENNENGKYVVSVRPFFQGNEFYYFVCQDYKDVRLVGTPPESIGKFGGDTDNWEWPRQTGDFSMFRVYADKNGNPAEYSKDNVPLTPKHHLPISLKGVQENDFAMILGYPGRTNRWMPAGGIEQNIKYAYPAWVEGAKTGMDQMKKYMDKDAKVRLQYASKYAQTANYWKNRQGMIDALTKAGTVDAKTAQEDKFYEWATKPANKEQYENVVPVINEYYRTTNDKARHDNYLMQVLRTSAYAMAPANLGNALIAYFNENDAKKAEMLPKINAMIEILYGNLYAPLEKDLLTAQLNLYASKAADYGLAPQIAKMKSENKGDFSKDVEKAAEVSYFSSKDKMLAFMANPKPLAIVHDPLYIISNDLMTKYRSKSPQQLQNKDTFEKAYRKLVEGLRVSGLNEVKYPDANSTLRLTYGKVRALPADSRNEAKINNYTDMSSLVKKYKKGDAEFDLPSRLLDLNKAKDFGQYADKNGYMPINFLTDNDITGGNSGSPVMNGKGELIGVAFDGNIEAMAGDVIFDSNLQRTINVDIRYVLWIIDKYAGAKNIINEMTIVK